MSQTIEYSYGRFKISLRPTTSTCDMENAINVTNSTGKFLEDLDDLLNLNTFFSKKGERSILAKRIKLLFKYLNEGSDPEFQKIYASMKFFIKSLKTIKEKAPDEFIKVRSNLKKERKSGSWDGHKFEVDILGNLLTNSVSAKKIIGYGKPDFQIDYCGNKLIFECTSCKIENSKGKDLSYKIDSAIKAKNNKPYANKNTCLAIDITNLMHHQLQLPAENENDPAFDLQGVIDNFNDSQDGPIKYGSILFYTYVLNLEEKIYACPYERYDTGCDEALLKLLDDKYPKSETRQIIKNYLAPAHS